MTYLVSVNFAIEGSPDELAEIAVDLGRSVTETIKLEKQFIGLPEDDHSFDFLGVSITKTISKDDLKDDDE